MYIIDIEQFGVEISYIILNNKECVKNIASNYLKSDAKIYRYIMNKFKNAIRICLIKYFEVSDVQKEKDNGLVTFSKDIISATEQPFELLKNIGLIAVILDLNGYVTDCNSSLLKLTGYTREDRVETIHQRKNGSSFDVENSVNYNRNNNGQIVIFINVITELKKYRNHLENIVRERTSELEITNKDLIEKNIKPEKYNQLFVNQKHQIKELKTRIKEPKHKK